MVCMKFSFSCLDTIEENKYHTFILMEGFVIYFAYDITMNPGVLLGEAGCRSAVLLGSGYMLNRRLSFNRESKRWSRAASVVESYGESVFGILYGISDEKSCRLLDMFESGAGRRNVRIRMRPNSRLINAVSYITVEDACVEEGQAAREYLEIMIDAIIYHELPVDYLSYVRSFTVIEP